MLASSQAITYKIDHIEELLSHCCPINYMKIYTKSGDKGETGLIDGTRISKDNQRIIAYGSVDELNSSIGLAVSTLKSNHKKNLFSDIVSILSHVQNDLFIIGSDLADPRYSELDRSEAPQATANMVSALESTIDNCETELTPIRFFIIPGGSIGSSLIHLSRTIARRAETNVVSLSKKQKINPNIITYLNRLSDLLFVIARLVNKRQEVEDIAWRVS